MSNYTKQSFKVGEVLKAAKLNAMDEQIALLTELSEQTPDDCLTANDLKTINGQSIVGTGDITISAGSNNGSSGGGTITGITMNGVSKGTSGVVDLGTVITSHQDISGKQDKLTSGTNIKTINNTSILGSGNIAVQPTLVSGTNIKTINGTSILGSGNITISGGSSSGSGNGAYSEVNHGTSDTTFTLTPNTFHVWEEVTSLELTFGDETSGVANEYLFQFTSGSEPTSLILPDDIKWTNDSAPTISADKIYQISVLKGLASCLEFENAQLISFSISSNGNLKNYKAIRGMTWSEWCSDARYNIDRYKYYAPYAGIVDPNYSYMLNVDLNSVIESTTYIANMTGSGGGGN